MSNIVNISSILDTVKKYFTPLLKWVDVNVFRNKNSWKYGAFFAGGGIAGIILCFNFTKKVTDLTHLQLTGKIFGLHSRSKYYDVQYNIPSKWKEIIPTARIRPSSELLNLVQSLKDLFYIDPKWTPQQHVNAINKLFKNFLPLSKMYPSYIPDPTQFKHTISVNLNNNNNNRNIKTLEINAYELRVPCVTAKNVYDNGIIFYIHGGGFMVGAWEFGLQPLYTLCMETGMVGITLDYPLVNGTDITINEQVQVCAEFYKYIANNLMTNSMNSSMNNTSSSGDNTNIYIAGESGGAALALLTLMKIEEYQISQPRGCIAMSPICCLALKSDSVINNEKYDIVKKHAFTNAMLVATGNMDMNGNNTNKNNNVCDEKYSIKYVNVEKWKNIKSNLHISASAYEMLRDDIRDTVQNAKQGMVNVKYEENLSCPHGVGAFADNSPETKAALLRIADWINEINRNNSA